MTTVEEDIHHSKKGLETAIRRISELRNGKKAIVFLYHLQASGLSTVRVLKYANHLPEILNAMDIEKAEKKDIETFVAQTNASSYKAWTKHGYKLTIKKLYQYLRNGNVSKETPYPYEAPGSKFTLARLKRNQGSVQISS
jgi:hypothetical protein